MIELGGGPDDSIGTAAEGRRVASASNRIRLAVEEEKIYRKVDGTRTVQAIIDASGAGEFEVCRTLLDLLTNTDLDGLVREGIIKAPGATLQFEYLWK